MESKKLYLAGALLTLSCAWGARAWAIQTHDSVGVVAIAPKHGERERALVSVDADDASLQHVIDLIARKAGLSATYTNTLISPSLRVTLHVRNVPVTDAFAQALRGTGVGVTISENGHAVFAKADGREVATGIIRGQVLDAKTKLPVRGASVMLDDATKRGVTTGSDGSFQMTAVAAGAHRITVRFLGYTRQIKNVMVSEGETATVEIALDPAVRALDQVVVTGTVVATELKAVPNAITVITAKQIEERGITRIEQLFRGDIPGLFARSQGSDSPTDEVFMSSRGATALSGTSVGTRDGTNPIKTYVDGVELANPRYLSQIDPASIERIEILTGPQASTIYGSGALNGVMQIFTKRGSTNRPQLTLNLQSGLVENNFRNARTPQHDYNAQLSGIEGRLSYNAGGGWNYVGPWTPAKQTARTTAFAGARLAVPTSVGTVNLDGTFRRSMTKNVARGSGEQGVVSGSEDGWWTQGYKMSVGLGTTMVWGQTLGATLGYAPTSWWSHELSIAQDASDQESRKNTIAYVTGPYDSLLSLAQIHADKRSLRYTTTARIPITSFAQATATLGGDSWQNLEAWSFSYPPTKLKGFFQPAGALRQPSHNTGGFIQTQLGLWDHLFLTYGLRAEWNPDFGADALPSYAPRYGAAYTSDFGPVTAKIRASYGRATRQPGLDQKLAIRNTDKELTRVYGEEYSRLANPDLGPEYQRGGEGGLELYFGGRASLVITRYNQTVEGLVTNLLGVDSLKSLMPNPVFYGFLTCQAAIGVWTGNICSSQDADGYGYGALSMNVNAGGIRNQGWELQGSVVTGPFTTRGTYSVTKSRSLGVPKRYLSNFPARLYPYLQPGASFNFLPEHTWAMGVTYAQARTTVAINVTGIGRTRIDVNEFRLRNIDAGIRLRDNRMRLNQDTYVSFNPGYALADLTASHRISTHVETVLEVQNLANHYTQDYNARFATIGRQGRAGFRIRLP